MTSPSRKFEVGDRVMRSDVTEDSIPSYRNMRGAVEGFDWTYVLVQWDDDKPKCCEDISHCGPTRHQPEAIKLADENTQSVEG